jgi:hypothetical protein
VVRQRGHSDIDPGSQTSRVSCGRPHAIRETAGFTGIDVLASAIPACQELKVSWLWEWFIGTGKGALSR